MAFDVDGARKAGYSDAEIVDHLAKTSGFDVAGARAAKYTDAELLSHLAGMQKPAPQAAPEGPSVARRVRNILGPTVEGAGAIAGGLAGAALGPAGVVGGAGLGYGIAKGGLRFLDQAAGWEAPQTVGGALATGAEDVLTGAVMESGGQIVARNLIPPAARGIGAVMDKFGGNRTKVKAGQIARDALGPDLVTVRNALQAAPDDLTAAQATSHLNSPTWQALAKNAEAHDPRFFGAGPLTPAQEAASFNKLASMAGGETQTAAIMARNADRNALNALLGPVRETELAAANTAGRLKPRLEGEANRMAGAAASKVEDVRRFTAATGRADARQATVADDINQYAHMGDLGDKAAQVATKSAADSLPLGEAARFAQRQADSLAAYNLRPLSLDAIETSIARTLDDPKLAGNTPVETVMNSVREELVKWTRKGGGIIDADALYGIRKNAVKAAVLKLGAGMEPAAQKALASDVTNRLSPLIDDAIIKAGGTGWKQYLADYAAGRQVIDQKKMGAEALKMLKANPRSFVELVEGNNPNAVNDVFGGARDSYVLGAQMDPQNMVAMSQIADRTRRGLNAADQSATGQTAFGDVMKQDVATFQLPNTLDVRVSLTNKVLRYVQGKFGTNAMEQLTAGMRNGKSAVEMLSVLPAKERSILLQAMQKPDLWMVPGAGAATGNALGMGTQ